MYFLKKKMKIRGFFFILYIFLAKFKKNESKNKSYAPFFYNVPKIFYEKDK